MTFGELLFEIGVDEVKLQHDDFMKEWYAIVKKKVDLSVSDVGIRCDVINFVCVELIKSYKNSKKYDNFNHVGLSIISRRIIDFLKKNCDKRLVFESSFQVEEGETVFDLFGNSDLFNNFVQDDYLSSVKRDLINNRKEFSETEWHYINILFFMSDFSIKFKLENINYYLGYTDREIEKTRKLIVNVSEKIKDLTD